MSSKIRARLETNGTWNSLPRFTEVSPARWCVTRGDVRQLQREIHAAIARGRAARTRHADNGQNEKSPERSRTPQASADVQ